ncbi:unnamed protein product [Adineta steineri]|uniref:THIF-type NAD/FAD binding fold domain-containing protein n=1 Tax=Adineta steineri TaxID=433720 RepID=A0A815H370_9BILA|nr:unnamed protein product [Adineta steineri]CAF1409360.1 unnamed protein product [Adineta steineri]
MGVDTIYLLDRDFVDVSNLNRQILFSLLDVGKSKTEAVAQHLKCMHNLRTNIYDYHMDAVTNWSCVVVIAKKCTVIFNNSEVNLFFGLSNDSCWACNNNTNDSFKFNIKEVENRNVIQLLLKERCCISGEQAQSIIEERSNEFNLHQP